jgi:hypothetical protein
MTTNAEIAARRDLDLYKKAVQKFGRLLTPVLGDIPKSLAFAHILRVNSNLETDPVMTWDQRKGFMRVTHASTTAAGIKWDEVGDLNKNSYVWGWDMNDGGPAFHTANSSFFPEPTEDFWKCLYTKHAMGPQVFNFFWTRRNVAADMQYDAVIAGVSSWGKHVAGWSNVRLKALTNIELPYVFAVSKINGTLSSSAFGLRPVLSANRTQQTLL